MTLQIPLTISIINRAALNSAVHSILANAGAILIAAVTAAMQYCPFFINLVGNKATLMTAVNNYLAVKSAANADAVEAAGVTASDTDANLETDITALETVIISIENWVDDTREATVFGLNISNVDANIIDAGKLKLLAALVATDFVVDDFIKSPTIV